MVYLIHATSTYTPLDMCWLFEKKNKFKNKTKKYKKYAFNGEELGKKINSYNSVRTVKHVLYCLTYRNCMNAYYNTDCSCSLK